MRFAQLVARAAVVACAACWLAFAAYAQDPRATAVASAARDWLAHVDRGDTAAAYKAASPRFRGTMASEAWGRALSTQRAPRGKLVQRTLMQTAFRSELAGGTRGDFAVLLFRTQFEKASDAGESVTLERDSDGAWRVVGYFIR